MKTKFEITAFWLKVIAMVTMVIDHIGYVFLSGTSYYMPARVIGRLAFPIFCFLLVEGALHTKNRRKYGLRLLISAICSEPFFDLLFFGTMLDFGHQNVMWTLFIAYLGIWLMEQYAGRLYVKFLVVLIAPILAGSLGTDYGMMGVYMIFAFYLFRQNGFMIKLVMITLLNRFVSAVQGFACFSMFLIYFYKGTQGPKKYRYLFYFFYPVHMLILLVIKYLL